MALRIGVLSAAHVHAPGFTAGFLNHPDAEVVGIWDDQADRGAAFAEARSLPFHADRGRLIGEVDAVVICSENMRHLENLEAAAAAGVHILCEKPIAPTDEHADAVARLISAKPADRVWMTAFPCPFSPSFQRMAKLIESGEIGRILALCCTNRGSCPFGWFVEPELSGGGAMIDHVVHVADLLWRLLGEEPDQVAAETGSAMYGQAWEDTAKVTLGYPSGVFATLDSSWSRPTGYKTWGDVTIRAVGEKGVLEADLFAQGVDHYPASGLRLSGTASDMDSLMVAEFIAAIREGREPSVTLADGLRASQVALAAYRAQASGTAAAV
ncbi:MAG: Gfo/Idh/MocA family oxidoreductase [Fimbriimonadaceae bacterium]|nr:Gfo/Idh/MocA family oxidoreductase [Fimbriimonadaceae bacterium]